MQLSGIRYKISQLSIFKSCKSVKYKMPWKTSSFLISALFLCHSHINAKQINAWMYLMFETFFLRGKSMNQKKQNVLLLQFSRVTKLIKEVLVCVEPFRRKIDTKCRGYFWHRGLQNQFRLEIDNVLSYACMHNQYQLNYFQTIRIKKTVFTQNATSFSGLPSK